MSAVTVSFGVKRTCRQHSENVGGTPFGIGGWARAGDARLVAPAMPPDQQNRIDHVRASRHRAAEMIAEPVALSPIRLQVRTVSSPLHSLMDYLFTAATSDARVWRR